MYILANGGPQSKASVIFGPGHPSLCVNSCNADTILEKDLKSTADELFEGPNLIETNPFGGMTINTALSPCDGPQKVCCQPNPINKRPLSPPEPYTGCGVHNPQGLKRGGVAVRYEPSTGKEVTSQEGEWPHTCLILKIENGGLQEKGKLNLSGKMGDKLGENKSFYTQDSMETM